jgi:hypothetical protein|tara:strand:+ start:131 stop:316 length:186 start_codon:yes stop_codon:yes gene_type:complete
MAKSNKNSGIYQQDAILGRFRADARNPQQISLVVAQALEAGKKNRAYLQERAKTQTPRFVL